MSYDFLKDFKLQEKASQECIEKYEQKLPAELINIWKNYGFGSFMNGYLRIINPDDIMEFFQSSYFNASESIPIMATAFGDLIIWENQEFVGIVEYRHGKSETIIEGFDVFMILLNDSDSLKIMFTLNTYEKALKKHGALEFDECYGYVPLLALGGKKSIANLKKVKMREHIALIVEMTGEI